MQESRLAKWQTSSSSTSWPRAPRGPAHRTRPGRQGRPCRAGPPRRTITGGSGGGRRRQTLLDDAEHDDGGGAGRRAGGLYLNGAYLKVPPRNERRDDFRWRRRQQQRRAASRRVHPAGPVRRPAGDSTAELDVQARKTGRQSRKREAPPRWLRVLVVLAVHNAGAGGVEDDGDSKEAGQDAPTVHAAGLRAQQGRCCGHRAAGSALPNGSQRPGHGAQ